MNAAAASTELEPLLDAAAGIAWLLVTGAVATAAWQWSRRLFPQDGPIALVGHTVVLGWGAVVLVATALGALGVLTGPGLLVCAAAVAAGGLLAARGNGATPPAIGTADRWWLKVWGVLGSIWVAHIVWNGVLAYPCDWDSLAYHIPLVDHWIQERSLWARGCSRWANPGNNELLMLWATAPFSGDFLLGLNNVPAALLLASCGVSAATHLGLPRPVAHLSGLTLVCNYVVLRQLSNQQNDVAVAALFFATLTYLLRHTEERDRGAGALGAVSLGLLAGVKYYALGYAVLLLAVWAALAGLSRGRRGAARAFAAGCVGLLVFGGYWYARNWVLTGTPLYPKGLLPETDLLSRIYPEVHRTSFFGNRRPELLELFIRAILLHMGPVPLLGALAAPVSFVWLLATATWPPGAGATAGRDGGEGRYRRVRWALAALLAGTGLLLAVTPVAVESAPGTLNQLKKGYCPVRYGMCFLGTATLSLVVTLNDLLAPARAGPRAATGSGQGPSRRALGGAAACVILLPIPWAVWDLDLDWGVPFLLAAALILASRGCAALRPLRIPVRRSAWVAGGLLTWGCVCASLSGRWHRGFVPHFDATAPFPGLKLYAEGQCPQTALVLQMRCYAYFGSRREHRVVQPVYAPSKAWLADLIREGGVTAVVTQDPPGADVDRRFAKFGSNPGAAFPHLRLVYEGRIQLYAVVPIAAPALPPAAADDQGRPPETRSGLDRGAKQ